MISDRLNDLGIVLPPVRPPVANYVSCVVEHGFIFVSGHGPIADGKAITGKVGRDLSVSEAQDAAKITAINILSTMQHGLGDLDRVERIVKVLGMVNAAPGFNQMPSVIDGCSNLLVEVFGEAGRHARSAIGVAELPSDIAVEIELIARVRG
jgi:enamine deaminase RidA (YjgF/YER057c/UK114 family)